MVCTDKNKEESFHWYPPSFDIDIYRYMDNNTYNTPALYSFGNGREGGREETPTLMAQHNTDSGRIKPQECT